MASKSVAIEKNVVQHQVFPLFRVRENAESRLAHLRRYEPRVRQMIPDADRRSDACTSQDVPGRGVPLRDYLNGMDRKHSRARDVVPRVGNDASRLGLQL